jgi:hypothetical protein
MHLHILMTILGSSFFTLVTAGGTSSNSTTPQFQGPCTDPSTAKYYSIDTRFNQCGETCFPPSKFNTFKLFERGLKAAEDDVYPCMTHGYTKYVNSPTHGVPGVLSVTVDLYKPQGSLRR